MFFFYRELTDFLNTKKFQISQNILLIKILLLVILQVLEGDNATCLRKGIHSTIDSYSAFWDNGHLSQTELFVQLIDRDITTVFACGLATDFCVAYTAFDSCTHGFQTFVIDDACRGVCDESIEGMKTKEKRNGIKIIESSDIEYKLSEEN